MINAETGLFLNAEVIERMLDLGLQIISLPHMLDREKPPEVIPVAPDTNYSLLWNC